MLTEMLVGGLFFFLLIAVIGLFIYHDSQIQKATYDDI